MKKDFHGHFSAVCSADDINLARGRPPSTQRGTAILEKGFLHIEVYDPEDRYHVTVLINEPERFNEHSSGLWLGRDLDNKLIAGPMIFTRASLGLDEAGSLLKSSTSTEAAFRLLKPTK